MRKFVSIEIYKLSSLTFQMAKNRQKCLKICKLPNFQILHATYLPNIPDASQPKGRRFDAAKTQEEGEKYDKKKNGERIEIEGMEGKNGQK